MAQRIFSTGTIWFTAPSGLIVEAGDCKDITLKPERSMVHFEAGQEFPVESRTGKGKIGGTIKMAHIRAALIGGVYGVTPEAGTRLAILAEPTGAISGATYTALHTTGFSNLGVQDTTGKWYEKVPSAPADGQYSVSSSGVYTFNSAANGKILFVRYTYTTTTGFTVPFTNNPVGGGSFYMLDMFNPDPVTGKSFGFTAYRVLIPSLTIPMKSGEFTEYDLEYSCMPDPTRLHPISGREKILDLYTSE